MLEHINYILPENLWLVSIDESNRYNRISFTIEGMSYSKEDISTFLAGLERFDKFSKVALESISPAPLAVRDTFSFVISVEFAASESPQNAKKKKK